ncbi:leader peptidase (prepilin peptidase)/N-methyltransferase [Clostridium acetobutylicum]|uniref:Predicted membrane protein n=1 Tax=Clostridium acetobutylicum (strain ATCC 824 / DSM 792 / JCM 1419 / IAM 19013 / LMG 5710 / NBRC 13948 / NRRL B-527 / VKM B-1787 / 2291 / W) TaxID=272562 RepID=Q97HN8_CLOAB|nr:MULTISPECIES: A24 family peptidase [Clostridium]AAK79932.1 Predicted membrane protein [Clostridium acetobutylicum ATCC 824]ADZ21025.1 membrane protein [Clostridium acetobutylicum EA 2018]AEI32103.1 hypothetical protein SMB_G2004 [Clostridium acetobutylicum DSM 1731]AWV79636.1 prepilin peptidase [Clostridium acetobutylicum]MBC2394391.1 prepilin peptidase [Clostridium acetobutylicum]
MVITFIYGIAIGYMTVNIAGGICKKELTYEFTTKECSIVAMILGLIYCLFYRKSMLGFEFFKHCVIATMLFLAALIDFKTKNVYFFITIISFLFSTVFVMITYFSGNCIEDYVVGAVAMGIISYIFALFKVIGLGDVEIFIICGISIGFYKSIEVLILSIFLCGIYGIFKIIKNIAIKKERVAFVPYILMAFVVVSLGI